MDPYFQKISLKKIFFHVSCYWCREEDEIAAQEKIDEVGLHTTTDLYSSNIISQG